MEGPDLLRRAAEQVKQRYLKQDRIIATLSREVASLTEQNARLHRQNDELQNALLAASLPLMQALSLIRELVKENASQATQGRWDIQRVTSDLNSDSNVE